MLPTNNRLSKHADIEHVKARANSFHSKNTTLLVLKSPNGGDSRFAFIVSTNVAKQAVERNRIKRILRDALRSSLDRVKDGYDCVVIAKRSANKKESAQLAQELNALLVNSNITKEKS